MFRGAVSQSLAQWASHPKVSVTSFGAAGPCVGFLERGSTRHNDDTLCPTPSDEERDGEEEEVERDRGELAAHEMTKPSEDHHEREPGRGERREHGLDARRGG